MTTPGGVPNLPQGALTIDNLAAMVQDMSGAAMHSRAVERFPSIMNTSTGLNPALELTPFGLLTRIFAEVQSLIANADPADIEGPEDLPALVQEWIEGLPFVGELVGLLEAIVGEYDGDDEVLLTVQEIFAPIRKLMELISGQNGIPSVDDIITGWQDFISAVPEQIRNLLPALLGRIPIGALTAAPQNAVPLGNFPNAASIYDNPHWIFDPAVTLTTDGTGSARSVCNGTERKLVGKDVISVAAGQKVALGSALKWEGVTATGSAFRFGVRTYLGDVVVSSFVELVAVSSPPASSTSYLGNAAGKVALTKEWTVPAGVDGYKPVFIRTTAATAGTVWFDDVSGKQTGTLQLSWMPEAVEKFLGIFGVFGSSGTLPEMQQAWGNLLAVFGIDVPDDLLGDIDIPDIWAGIVSLFINPLGFFANLVGGKLPDSQKPAWLQNLTDGIGNLFNGASDTNLAIPNALSSLSGIWGTGQSAQRSADDANIGVQIVRARLDAPGFVGFDEFDYGDSNTLPSDKYSLSSTGPGGGNYGPNGRGQLVWKPSGFTAREKVYKRTDQPLTTNNGVVTAVWSTRVKDPLFSDGYGYLLGRCLDANNDTRVQATIDNNTARIQVVNAGVVTTIGPTANVSTSDGDVWEFWFGTLTNPYLFWLKQNGVAIPFGSNRWVEDTGHISQVSANHRMCGIGGRSDNYAAIFQIPPPTLNGWTWRDQNATAAAA